MKKVFSVILLVILLVLATVAAQAEGGLTLTEVKNLLTDSTWELNASYGSANKQVVVGFDTYAKTLHLPDKTIYLTEDGSGDIYLAVGEDAYAYTAMGKVTFSEDRNTMVIIVDDAYISEWFTYNKK